MFKFIDHMESDHKDLIGDLWDCSVVSINHRPYICLCLCNIYSSIFILEYDLYKLPNKLILRIKSKYGINDR